jgi:hypothetical protein
MATIHAMQGIGAITADTVRAFKSCDQAIVNAINAAKDAGVPQGLIVAVLHGHAHNQTQAMMEG